ncbi:MAG TPA: riboflavin synthase [Puia sp.]|nr:riboflavin synthase [Puia sp.]
MFTGIIETTGVISTVSGNGTNKTFQIISSLAPELRVDQSLSHDGVCLTVESVTEHTYQVTAITETLSRSTLSDWRPGNRVNLERCLQFNGRLDGHLVQGHVDSPAKCINRENLEGSWVFRFEYPESYRNLVIEKGSIAVNGISLTCFNVTQNAFSVAIIPYTYDHTNIRDVYPESMVNIEYDLIGKYVQRMVNHEISMSKQA